MCIRDRRLLVEAASNRLLRSAHDCAEGGFAVALAECCIEGEGGGASVELPSTVGPHDGFGLVRLLFGEAPTRVLVSVLATERHRLLEMADAVSLPALVVGKTGGERIRIAVDGDVVADIRLEEARNSWVTGFTRHFESVPWEQ